MTTSAFINKHIRVLKTLPLLALVGFSTQIKATEPNIGIIPNAIDKEIEAKFIAFNEQCMLTAKTANMRGSGFVYGVKFKGDKEPRMQCVPHPMLRAKNKDLSLTFNLTKATKVKGCRDESRMCSVETKTKQGLPVTKYLFNADDDDLYIAGIVTAPNIDMSEHNIAYYTLVSKKCYQRSEKQFLGDVLGLYGATLVCLTGRSSGTNGCRAGGGKIIKDTSSNLLGDLTYGCLNQ